MAIPDHYSFDLGTSDSPIAAGWIQVTQATTYTRYLVTGDSHVLNRDLRGIIGSLSANIEMSTDLWTTGQPPDNGDLSDPGPD